VTPGANFDATMAMTGYAHTFSMFDRSAMAAVILPMGRISGDVTTGGEPVSAQSAERLRRPDARIHPQLDRPQGAERTSLTSCATSLGFSVDMLADLAMPIGEYDSKPVR
jgi:hypothetical protein